MTAIYLRNYINDDIVGEINSYNAVLKPKTALLIKKLIAIVPSDNLFCLLLKTPYYRFYDDTDDINIKTVKNRMNGWYNFIDADADGILDDFDMFWDLYSDIWDDVFYNGVNKKANQIIDWRNKGGININFPVFTVGGLFKREPEHHIYAN